jgi:hypothetical protein
MKPLNLLVATFINMAFITVASSQCYPVQLPISQQIEDTLQYQGPASNLFYTQSYTWDDSTQTGETIYHIFENGMWSDLTPMPGGAPYLVRWGNKIIAYGGGSSSYHGVYAPNGMIFGFLQYSNGKWDTLPGGLISDRAYIKVVCTQKDLWSLHYNPSWGYQVRKIFKYNTDSGKFVQVAVIEKEFQSTSENNFMMHGGKERLLLSNFDKINGMPTAGFAYIEDNVVKTYHGPAYGNLYGINRKNDDIIIFHTDEKPVVFTFDAGGTLKTLKTNLQFKKWTQIRNPNCVVVDDKIVWTMTGYNEDGSGQMLNVTNYTHVLCIGEKEWKVIEDQTNDWYPVVACQNRIYRLHTNGLVYEITNGAVMYGTLFVDSDSNCRYDEAKDVPLPGKSVIVPMSTYKLYSRTDETGRYNLYVEKDTLVVGSGLKLSGCMRDTVEIISDSTLKDVALEGPTGFNVKIESLNASVVRWNGTTSLMARVSNLGRTMDSLHFLLKCKRGIKILQGKHGFHHINDSTVECTIYKLNCYASKLLQLGVWIDTATCKPGDILKSVWYIESFVTETNYKDNIDTTWTRVVYSLDPNHKLCRQERIPVKSASRLDYIIEFQNEGDDDAYDVVIEDTLEYGLIPSSLILSESSHPYSASLKDNVLRITFRDIYLKPKKFDELRSKGFISFSIETRDNLKEGDKINNRAYIFFDLNKPVITNDIETLVTQKPRSEVKVKEIKSVVSKIHVFPNPARESIAIMGSSEDIYIYNLMGELIYKAKGSEDAFNINIASWTSGLYFIRSGQDIKKFIKTD